MEKANVNIAGATQEPTLRKQKVSTNAKVTNSWEAKVPDQERLLFLAYYR
ncbi:MAG: hypothetical protein IPP46_20095 [Bacteroidetes bacterium]|nr:hypothetical protein [Bacteroidota bacterium]